jgi:hypothetical protein
MDSDVEASEKGRVRGGREGMTEQAMSRPSHKINAPCTQKSISRWRMNRLLSYSFLLSFFFWFLVFILKLVCA